MKFKSNYNIDQIIFEQQKLGRLTKICCYNKRDQIDWRVLFVSKQVYYIIIRGV